MTISVNEWRELILAGWQKWGTGNPLDPKTVEHLAQEFAKPLIPDWHGKEPFVKIDVYDLPWKPVAMNYYSMMFSHRRAFMPPCSDSRYWWDGSCRVTALVKEGPKAIVLVRK